MNICSRKTSAKTMDQINLKQKPINGFASNDL